MLIAVIGGGAAGFFAAISAKEHHPESEVYIFEKSDKLLAKVKVSGGGRCNVTHACFKLSDLLEFYPRGSKFLKTSFRYFNTQHTLEWFSNRGVLLKTETDNRMFPSTDSSQTIINCLMEEAAKLGVIIQTSSPVENFIKKDKFEFICQGKTWQADKVIVATGGSPKASGFDWLTNLGHSIETPVPSLFTFNMPSEKIKELMGVVAPNALVKVQSSKLHQQGPLLITHWGMSGPAILKLSAWGARELSDKNYQFNIPVNWVGIANEDVARNLLMTCAAENGKKKIANQIPFDIPSRLWDFLLEKSEINPNVIYAEQNKKSLNRLLNNLLNDVYQVSGKTTFKEEFVTCGGIKLMEVNPETLESKIVPNLYFAGEVLDIDGVTGGFNFQAAWTTGFLAGR